MSVGTEEYSLSLLHQAQDFRISVSNPCILKYLLVPAVHFENLSARRFKQGKGLPWLQGLDATAPLLASVPDPAGTGRSLSQQCEILCWGMLSPTLVKQSREKCSMITVTSDTLVFSCQSSLSWHNGSLENEEHSHG